MRKLRRKVLRSEAERLSRYGKNGKSVDIFRGLWSDFKELQKHGELAKAEKGLLKQIRAVRKAMEAEKEKKM